MKPALATIAADIVQAANVAAQLVRDGTSGGRIDRRKIDEAVSLMTMIAQAAGTTEERLEIASRLIGQARVEWLEANDPNDGTDAVTPYDVWFYRLGRTA
jgi:hypothetical protein